MTIISLFSGAGGLDLGMIQAGNTVVWANDIDANAVKTYRYNIGDHIICADIKDIDISSIPNADVVIGGFPCQGFSMQICIVVQMMNVISCITFFAIQYGLSNLVFLLQKM